jgi:hypothetical protein
MERNNTANLIDCDEFEHYTRKAVQALGPDSIRFFTVIHDLEEFFLKADTVFKTCPMKFTELEDTGKKIAAFLGEEESARFFKSIYSTIPKKTLHFLGIMVKFFELAENYEIR